MKTAHPLPLCAALLLAVVTVHTHASKPTALWSPTPGVLCDRHVCADGTGISVVLTKKHLGKNAATRLRAHGNFDQTQFTFANGVFCDVKERLCREGRFHGADGTRGAPVITKYTEQLFGPRSSQERPRH